MIKASLGVLAILLGVGLCSSDKADASGCGRAEVQAITCGAVHMRPGQIRRANRRAAREHRRALRRGCAYSHGHVAVGCAGVVAPRCAGVVHVATPAVAVAVDACCP